MKFASSGTCPTKASKILEFLRINLEFLEITLLPRNDAGNSRISYIDPPVKLGDDRKRKLGMT